ncbi:NAD(P)/FAD-dependent oxidoreductase [Moheibacter sediminis]|uniref:NADH:ubiquinone reductase (non-electrogenic) n=1 Tax=Moheibacter sediminis TaxID=1434700 RepID=A0A1W1Z6T9_9FLAO|nr:NAD(P)/FAD-dependent oxidoreductase [Moheibacter sediminis]SMC43851.1 NADH dehydrogenase [Moheibacter sediminis]
MNIPDINLKRIVIIGGGFGGLRLAKKLTTQNFQVVLLDRHNYHTFQPLLYQVATAGLEPDSIAHAIRTIFAKKENFFFRIANVEKVDTLDQKIYSDIGNIHYDYLIIATGSETNYYGNENIQKHSMPMKTVPEALDLRSLILQNLESALLTNDLDERYRLMNYVIVGGGPTGVELAGAMGELKKHVLPNDYPDLDIRRMNVHLIQAADRLLPTMSHNASDKARKYLEELGVQVWFNTLVKDYDGIHVDTDGKDLKATTLIWTAGVKGAMIPGVGNDENAKGGRLLVNEFNLVKGYDNVYAIGDIALMITEKNPQGDPMVAQVAIQQGQLLAKNLNHLKSGKPMKPFKYNDKGSMATIGRDKAVVDLPGWKFAGWFAWLVWMFVHLVSLVGFRNKVIALMNWVVQYFQYNKSVRLIIRPYRKKH